MPKLLFIIFFLIYSVSVSSQSRKFYTIKDDNSYDKIIFRVKAESGNYKIRPSNRSNVIDIFGSPNHENLNPSFTSKKIELNLLKLMNNKIFFYRTNDLVRFIFTLKVLQVV